MTEVPSFTIGASDAFAVPVLRRYQELCREFRLGAQTARIGRGVEEFVAWQEQHPASLPTGETA